MANINNRTIEDLFMIIEQISSQASSTTSGDASTMGQLNRALYQATLDVINDQGGGGDATRLGGQLPAFYLSRVNHTGTQTSDTISNFQASVSSNSAVQANTNKISASGSVTTHSDITSAGSGAIITSLERDKLNDIEDNANNYVLPSDVVQDSNYSTFNTNTQNHISSTSNPHSVTATQIGLGSVDNTADANKPVSTATQTAIDLKADSSDLTSHTSSTSNPHSVTATQVGLGNVDNTSDVDKPISTATQTALGNIVQANGSVTTHNDVTSPGSGQIITDVERTKLNGIAEGAQVNAFRLESGSNSITGFWAGTQAEYDAIVNKINTVIYIIDSQT